MDIKLCDDDDMPNCDMCHKKLRQGFGHCSRCFQNVCDSCECNYYDCYGNHYFTEHACDLCFPKYSQVVNGVYYCPKCAPDTSYYEAKFKNDVHSFDENCLQHFFKKGKNCIQTYPFTDEELNDPKNWMKHYRNPFYYRTKIRKFYDNQFKPKKVWRVKEK